MDSDYHFRFEDLQIYSKAMDFGELVNILTKKFPKDERFELTSPFKRASDSIALNIAEGSAGTDPQFHNYLGNSWYSTNVGTVQMNVLVVPQKLILEITFQKKKVRKSENNVLNFQKLRAKIKNRMTKK